jgi:hypothetical protein
MDTPGLRARAWRPAWALGAAAAIVCFLAIGYAVTPVWHDFHAENGPEEVVQAGLWFAAAAVSLSAVLAGGRPWNDRLGVAWLGALALTAGARELDLHTKLNPETLGEWGVRYRMDWWLDFSVPLSVKLLWSAIFLGMGAAIIGPAAVLRPPLGKALRRGDPVAVLLAMAGMGVIAGFVADDLLRGVFAHHGSQAAEEALELCGVSLFLGAAIVARVRVARGLPWLPLRRAASTGAP